MVDSVWWYQGRLPGGGGIFSLKQRAAEMELGMLGAGPQIRGVPVRVCGQVLKSKGCRFTGGVVRSHFQKDPACLVTLPELGPGSATLTPRLHSWGQFPRTVLARRPLSVPWSQRPGRGGAHAGPR